jgi:hypothetical protein
MQLRVHVLQPNPMSKEVVMNDNRKAALLHSRMVKLGRQS